MSLWIIDIKKTELDRTGVNWSGGINIGNRPAICINQSPSVSTLDGSRFWPRSGDGKQGRRAHHLAPGAADP